MTPPRSFPCGRTPYRTDPVTIHHACLGLVVAYPQFSGIYLLPDGDIAAVYGAEAIPLGQESVFPSHEVVWPRAGAG